MGVTGRFGLEKYPITARLDRQERWRVTCEPLWQAKSKANRAVRPMYQAEAAIVFASAACTPDEEFLQRLLALNLEHGKAL